MRRSKLETCLSILETLDNNGSLKITRIMQKCNINCNVLKNYFVFLIKQGAIEKKYVERDKIVYAITERGSYLIRCLNGLDKVIPTMKIRSEIPVTNQRMDLARMSRKNIVNLQGSNL